MDKILVTFYVLSLEEEFDVFIPINVKLAEVLNTIQQTILEMSEGNYVINPNPLLYNDLDGKLININNIVKFSGLMNGSRVMIKWLTKLITLCYNMVVLKGCYYG